MLDLSKLVCNPHHGTPPDRNRVAGYRRGLASLSVVKERLFRVHRNAPVGFPAAALSSLTALRSRQIHWLGTCLAGLTCSLFFGRGLRVQTLEPGASSPSSSA